MKKKDYNPVCYFKRQGDTHDILKKYDFMLVIITEIQRELLLKFGNNVICIDTAQRTNRCDFQLTTLLVVDNDGESFPAAFCLSNVNNFTIMQTFFKQIRLKTRTVFHPRIFLSSDFEFYRKAWASTMGVRPPKELLCAWYVYRNWRSNLKKIEGEDAQKRDRRIKVLEMLRTLLVEKDETVFLQLLGRLVTNVLSNKDTEAFGEYFKSKWLNRTEKWAYCYQVGNGIDVNMKLGVLYEIVKHAYNKGRKMERLDRCIYSLLRVVREKFSERFLKMKNLRSSADENEVKFGEVKRSAEYLTSLLHNSNEVPSQQTLTYIKNQLNLCMKRILEAKEISDSNLKKNCQNKFICRPKKSVGY